MDASIERNKSVISLKNNLHHQLTTLNQSRLSPKLPTEEWMKDLTDELKLKILEGHFIESLRLQVNERASQAPLDGDGFMEWFEELKNSGPGQGDPLFPWLASKASLEEMKWFLSQEIAGEAGFDDLVALTQVKMPPQAKLELARNYWDEMGRGNPKGMHGPLLEQTANELGIKFKIENTVCEALALANLMLALASNRRYAFHAVGALGAIEMTAPTRVCFVNKGLERLGLSPKGRQYFQLHSTLDIQHSTSWNREVIKPLITSNPHLAKAIAEGALMRLLCGQRCFIGYRRELGLSLKIAPSL